MGSVSPTPPVPTPLSPEHEAEIRERLEAATPGPWQVERDNPTLSRLVVSEDRTLVLDFGYLGNNTQPDAEFTAHARDDIPALLDEIDRLRSDRAAFRTTVLNAAIDAARSEYLEDNTGTPEDEAYDNAVSDVVAAIGALLETPAAVPVPDETAGDETGEAVALRKAVALLARASEATEEDAFKPGIDFSIGFLKRLAEAGLPQGREDEHREALGLLLVDPDGSSCPHGCSMCEDYEKSQTGGAS